MNLKDSKSRQSREIEEILLFFCSFTSAENMGKFDPTKISRLRNARKVPKCFIKSLRISYFSREIIKQPLKFLIPWQYIILMFSHLA